MSVQLLQGDCLELMKDIPDGSVDMVLADPPYSSGGLFAGDRKASTRTKYCDRDYNGAARFQNFSGDNMDQRSFTEFMRMVLNKCRQKAKPESVCAVFVDWRNLPALTDALQMSGWVWRGIVVWNKGNSRNVPGRFRNDCEYIVWGSNGNLPLNRSSRAWFNSEVELMNEKMVFGAGVFAPVSNGSLVPLNNTLGNTQFPLFRFARTSINILGSYWLRDIVNSSTSSAVSQVGYPASHSATNLNYVRPYFCIAGN